MREHYITAANLAKAQASIQGALYMRVFCGARPTERADLSATTNVTYVDCKRCLNALEKLAAKSAK